MPIMVAAVENPYSAVFARIQLNHHTTGRSAPETRQRVLWSRIHFVLLPRDNVVPLHISAWITLIQLSALFRRSLPKLVCERANMTIVATAADNQRTGRPG